MFAGPGEAITVLPLEKLFKSPELALCDKHDEEITGKGYRRQPVSLPDCNVYFGEAEGDWGEIASAWIYDGGERVQQLDFGYSRYINRGDTVCVTVGDAEPPKTPEPTPYYDDGDGYRDYYDSAPARWWSCAYCGSLMSFERGQCSQCGGWRESL